MKFWKMHLIIALCLIFAAGCSADNAKPIVTPDLDSGNTGSFLSLSTNGTGNDSSGRDVWGMWTASFDSDYSKAVVTPFRNAEFHYNVTAYIPVPDVVVNSYDPLTNEIDVDVTIDNIHPVDGWDVRLIIYTNDEGQLLLNSDGWTPLYDIPLGEVLNPFKAYAKTEPNRIFTAETQHTENLLIYLPDGNMDVAFAIDVSREENCSEPYEISGFTQGELFHFVGASTDITINVLDWSDDVADVRLHCPEITGLPLNYLEQTALETWEMEIVNNTAALAGDYPAWVYAFSADSGTLAMYNKITITVSEAECTDQELMYDFASGCELYECQGWICGGCSLENSDQYGWGNFKFCDYGTLCDGTMFGPYITSGGDGYQCDSWRNDYASHDWNITSPSITLPPAVNSVIEWDQCRANNSDAVATLYISENDCDGPWIEIWSQVGSNGCNEKTAVDISDYSGSNVMFRFQHQDDSIYTTSGDCENSGLTLDNIRIHGCFSDDLVEN